MKKAFLIFDDTSKNMDLFYLTKFSAPDAYLFFSINNKKYIVLSELEYNKGKEKAEVAEILKLSDYLRSGDKIANVIDRILREFNIDTIEVLKSFSYELGKDLELLGYNIEIYPYPSLRDREFKTPIEASKIRDTCHVAGAAIDYGINIIKESIVKKDMLFWNNGVLTSEILQKELFNFMLQEDCISMGEEGIDIIASCGKYSIIPHHTGFGSIYANETIVFDVFPRSMTTAYFGDMSRTVVKGTATDELKKMYHAVLKAQEMAISMIKHGVDGKEIHEMILNFYKSIGYENKEINGGIYGYIHGTGHGLGLQIHEPPRISTSSYILEEGHVVSVEPGLYYPDIGGVRIEDIVYVTRNGCEMLTNYPRELEI